MISGRKSNFFEFILLLIGVAITVIGFFIINRLFVHDGAVTWDLITAVFLWLALILMTVIAATQEDVKEELGLIIRELSEEIKILKEISSEHLKET
jgi:ATP/ADP translocase